MSANSCNNRSFDPSYRRNPPSCRRRPRNTSFQILWIQSTTGFADAMHFAESWSAEFRGLDGNVCLYFLQLSGVSAVQPGEFAFKRELNAADVPVIGVVDLRRHAADGRPSRADRACQKPGVGDE